MKLIGVVCVAVLVMFAYVAKSDWVPPAGATTTGVDANVAAKSAGRTSECIVSSSVATDCPATPLSGRRAIELQNLGENAIYCTLGGSAPVIAKSRRIGAGSSFAVDLGDAVVIKCLASQADQVTLAATIVTEIR
jgi:hypothetical protein